MSFLTGGSESSSESGVSKYAKEIFQNNLNTANATANTVKPQMFSPRTADYNVGSEYLRQNNLAGMNTVNQAASAANSVAGYNPQQVQAATYQASLMNAANAGPAALARSQGYDATNAGSQGYDATFGNAAQLQGSDIQNYMNPYTSQVADAAMSDLNRQRALAGQQQAAQAIGQRAFGGSRSDMQRAVLQGEYDRTAANTLSNLYNTGFNTALGAAQSDVANRQNMTLANLGYGNQASQFGAGAANTAALANAAAANQASQFGANAFNTGSMFNAGQRNNMSQYNAGLQQQANVNNQSALNQASQFNAGAMNAAGLANQSAGLAAAGLRSGAASQLAGIGQQQQQMMNNAATMRMNLGLTDQNYFQQQLDAYRNNPMQQQAIRNQALGINPMGGSGMQTSGSGSSTNGLLSFL